MTRNIGINVKVPKEEPKEGDKKNPFNGTLPVRGILFEGKVVKAKGKDTVVLQKEAPVYYSKFKRYGRSKILLYEFDGIIFTIYSCCLEFGQEQCKF